MTQYTIKLPGVVPGDTSAVNLVVAPSTLNNTVSIPLIGRYYENFGQVLNQSLVDLLSHNSRLTSEPPNPQRGEIWYDMANRQLRVFVGAPDGWLSINSSSSSGSNADLLNGQPGSYYLDLPNATGSLSASKLSGSLTLASDISGTVTFGSSSTLTINALANVPSLVTKLSPSFVAKAGDVMTGSLEVQTALKITHPSSTGPQRLLFGNQVGGGVQGPAVLSSQNGTIYIGKGDSWTGNGGTVTPTLVIDTSTGATVLGSLSVQGSSVGSVVIQPGANATSGAISLREASGSSSLLVYSENASKVINVNTVGDYRLKFNTSPLLPGDAVGSLEAVPKQQLDSAVLSLTTTITNVASQSAPVGTVALFATMYPPEGWLKCNGAWVSEEDFPELFNFALNSGNTTNLVNWATQKEYGSFASHSSRPNEVVIPDLRGYFVRGWDDGRGVDAGRGIGTSQLDEIKSHAHPLPADGQGYGAGEMQSLVGSGNNDEQYTWAAPTGYVGGSETRPINVALMFCIKYK